jgi:hypothetical protein
LLPAVPCVAACSIAEQRIAAADLNNITLHNPDHGPEHSLPGKPTFTLVMVHDALHDMTRPDMCLKVGEGRVGAGKVGEAEWARNDVCCRWGLHVAARAWAR